MGILEYKMRKLNSTTNLKKSYIKSLERMCDNKV